MFNRKGVQHEGETISAANIHPQRPHFDVSMVDLFLRQSANETVLMCVTQVATIHPVVERRYHTENLLSRTDTIMDVATFALTSSPLSVSVSLLPGYCSREICSRTRTVSKCRTSYPINGVLSKTVFLTWPNGTSCTATG
jgi:hypothetical protein